MMSLIGIRGLSDADRVLEDDLHPAAHLLEGVAVEGEDVLAVERHRACRRRDEAQDRPPQGRLAAAGLTHEAQRLAAADVDRDVVDRVHLPDRPAEHPARDREVLLDVA